MDRYILHALFAFHIYLVIYYCFINWRHALRARSLGCQKPYRYRTRLPIGIDYLYSLVKADREHRIPQQLLEVHREVGHTTFTQNILGTDAIVTTDPKNVQAVLALQFGDFGLGETRRKNFFPMLGNGIFTSDGKAWEHSRAMLRPQFSRNQISDLNLEEKHVRHMLNHITADASGWTGSIDIGPIFFRLTMDSTTEFLFGQSTNSQVAHDPKSCSSMSPGLLRWSAVAASFDRGTSVLGTRARLQSFYWFYNPRYFRDDCVKIRQFADYCIERALRRRQSNKPAPYIFLDELLDKTQDKSEIRSQLLNIFLAGRDTTAGLLGWTFWSLARNRDIFAKLRACILEHFGGPGAANPVTFEGLKSCTYIQHVMQETLRLYPSVPFNNRQATRNTTLPRGGGPDGSSPVYVRKDQIVGYSVYAMHRNQDLWGEDADIFNPDRWVGRKSGWDYLPFNGGPRVCLGQQFALTEAAYVITRLLQQFDRIENTDLENEPLQQYSLTSAPKKVLVRLHKA